ncbi:MAG: hypothetical protein KGK07_08740 [Chloroflexota bacterium]|nr:hypothetical protein [Chloroflexota bacterium]
MRLIPIIALALAAAMLAACGGGSPARVAGTPAGGASPAASAAVTPAASRAPVATPTRLAGNSTPVAPGESVEVRGIVGTITTDPEAIEITRLSGAAVNRILVKASTVIRSAGGGTISFAAIRTSDRIIADGRIDDRGDALVAAHITVSAVVPGAQPGG